MPWPGGGWGGVEPRTAMPADTPTVAATRPAAAPAHGAGASPGLGRPVGHLLVGHPLAEQLAQSFLGHVGSSNSSASSGAAVRSRARAACVWLFTVPVLTPSAVAVSRSLRSS